MIELSDIHVTLGRGKGRTDIRAPNLSVAAGEAACLSGQNGSGKTTLLRVLAGSVSPATGQVRVQRPTVAFTDIDRQLQAYFGRSLPAFTMTHQSGP
ncbi:ATP-binding cassette domain-containing protein [Yoonia vestfoldensis]|uniref:ATP-binding cassette domain-containing protein n=1 Tax=Yoonia vestfoldensis TaxID=245188 RepID=UPI000B38A247